MKNPLKEINITQAFGANPDKYKVYGMKGHNGLDFRASIGTPVFAAHDGEIKTKVDDTGYGKHAIVANKEFVTCYAHLERFAAVPQSKVQAGDLIGFTGNTGNSTGPHLHFGVRELDMEGNIRDYDNGYWGWKNPIPYFEPEAEANSLIGRIFSIFKQQQIEPKAALAIIPDDHGRVYLIKNGEKREAKDTGKIIEAILAVNSVGISQSDISKIKTGRNL